MPWGLHAAVFPRRHLRAWGGLLARLWQERALGPLLVLGAFRL